MANSSSNTVALPAYLRKGLDARKIIDGETTRFEVRDKLLGTLYDFEDWQYFLLEVLPGISDFETLGDAFSDRFGRELEAANVDELFTKCAQEGLLGIPASRHALLKDYCGEHPVRNALQRWQQRKQEAEKMGVLPDISGLDKEKSEFVAGVKDVLGIDDGLSVPKYALFDPTPQLKKIQDFLPVMGKVVYALPLLFIVGFFTLFNNTEMFAGDVKRVMGGYGFFTHVSFGRFTVNLLCTVVQAMVAFHFRATVKSISVIFLMFFIPRFLPEFSHVQQMNRKERLWLHGSTLLVRAACAAAGVVIWFGTRSDDGFMQFFGLSLFMVGSVALLLTVNPLLKSSGAHMLAVFVDEPMLRGKAFKALLNKVKGSEFTEANENWMALYAVLSLLFSTLLLAFVLFIFGLWLELELSGSGIIIILGLSAFLMNRAYRKLQQANIVYERSLQIERWRKQRMPENLDELEDEKEDTGMSNGKKAALATFLIVMFLPYPFQPGGEFQILPSGQNQIATDIEGIVAEVYFEGGETLERGTPVAMLAADDYIAQVAKYDARVAEQDSIVKELIARPKPEEIALAQAQLETARTRLSTSKAEFERFRQSYDKGAISLQDFELKKRKFQNDESLVDEKLAQLELVKKGSSKDEIDAARAKKQRFIEERDFFQKKIDRSTLYMPMDGTIVTLHLKQKEGKFLGQGEPFALVEDASQMRAEIRIPESDAGFVETGAKVIVRTKTFPDKKFTGVVQQVDVDVTDEAYGNVVTAVAMLENPDGRLKSGMTGYAKIESESLPVWQVFTRPIWRFIQVEIWSWIP
jgi:putative peptide zinc metalloprotease protein